MNKFFDDFNFTFLVTLLNQSSDACNFFSFFLLTSLFVFFFLKNDSDNSEPYVVDILSSNEKEIAKILGSQTFCGIPGEQDTMKLGK